MSISIAETDLAPAARADTVVSRGIALLPGLAVCGVATAAAVAVNRVVPTASPLLIAIVLGAVIANATTLPAALSAGMQFSAKRLLRVGIALLGLQLMLRDIAALGWGVIVMVVAIVVLGILGTLYAGRLLGVPWTQRLLIGCGFSICGAAAVAATDGVVEADEEEVLTGIALVVLFGTLMIPIVPLLSNCIGLSDRQGGLWAGGSIHEVAQVVAAGGAIGGHALAVAVVVKLARVLMLAPVMAVLSIRQRRRAADADIRRPPLMPLFVVAFVACVGIRSAGLVPTGVVHSAQLVQTALLTAAMFALGAGVRFATIRKVGMRPLLLATISTAWVALIALAGAVLA
jgi:uncharacterized integral membrane protein (TIGR00698 family)